MAETFNPNGPALLNLTSAIDVIAKAHGALRDYTPAHAASATETQSVEELRDYIASGAATLGDTIALPCMFYPALLLRRGWWQNDDRIKVPSLRGPVQRWLTHGMFEWAPSWEFPSTVGGQPAIDLPAQAGDEDSDESDSIAVLVVGRDAVERVRQTINDQVDRFGRIAFRANLTGQLMQIEDLAQNRNLSAAELALDPSSYVLLVHEVDPHHRIVPDASYDTRPDYPIYSGYLWKCVAPENWRYPRLALEWDPGNQPLGINDVYFIWEHTNLTSHESVVYNLISINQKIEYLEQLHGTRFQLLEQSCNIVSEQRPAGRNYLQDLLAERLHGTIS